MWPVSDRFLAAHRASSQVVTCRAQLWRDGAPVADLDVVGGSVSVDSRRAVRRTITAELASPDGSLVPSGPDDPMVPTGSQVRVWRGIVLPDGTTEEVPLGVFRVTAPAFEVTDSGLRITVDGSDEACTVQAARLTTAWTIPAGTPVGAGILALLADRHPALPTRDDSPPSTTVGAPVVIPAGADSDPWQACLDLAAQFGLDLAIDPDGTAVVRDLPTSTTPVVAYARGDEAVLLRISRKLSVDTTYSGVVVTSDTDDADGGVPVAAEAWDTDPASPTYALGPFGRRPYFIASNLITTVEQAQATADAHLPQVTGVLDEIEWEQVVNPALDVGDAVSLIDTELRVNTILTVVALDIPLTADGAMTAVTRSQTMRAYTAPVAEVPTDTGTSEGGTTLVMPDATNTGHSGTLTAVSGDQTITTPGTVLENLNIAGRVIVQAANVTIRNCLIRGNGAGSSNIGLISAYYSSTVGLVVEDVTLAPATPSIWWTGILGHDYTARRVHAYNVVDGFGVYNTTTPTAPANVLIEGCYVHDLAYLSPDSNHGDNHTHNDGIQIQGNGGVVIRGNRLLCNAGAASNATSPYDPSCTGQAIGITPTVSTVTDVTIEDNWLDYGAQSITVAEGSKGASGITIRRNRFGRGQPLLTKDGTAARRPVIVDPDVTAPGLPATTWADTAGNVYDDDGTPITITRTNSY